MDRKMYNKMVRLIKHNMNIACDIDEEISAEIQMLKGDE